MDKMVSDPDVVLREETDEWGILFDPNTGKGFAINLIGSYVWKRLDGKHSVDDILREIKQDCDDVPENAKKIIEDFIQGLIKRGLVAH